MRVAESTHKLALLHKPVGRLADFSLGDLGTVLEDVMDFFSSAYSSIYSHFLDATVGSGAYSNPSKSHTGEGEWPQLGVAS